MAIGNRIPTRGPARGKRPERQNWSAGILGKLDSTETPPAGDPTSAVAFGLARDTPILDGVFRLVHDQYVSRGYMAPHRSRHRLSLQQALPSTRIFVATAGAVVTGTMTLIQDSPLGLPMDAIYREELAAFRAHGRRLGEASALAVSPQYRSAGFSITVRLVRMLILYAAEIARLDDICFVVNPRHVTFYREYFHSHPIGPRRRYPHVNEAPAQALHLDLDTVRALIRALRDGASAPPFDEFLYSPPSYHQVMTDLTNSALTPAQFTRFFVGHAALEKASPPDRAFVASLYSNGRPGHSGGAHGARRFVWQYAAAVAAAMLFTFGVGVNNSGDGSLPTPPPGSARAEGPGALAAYTVGADASGPFRGSAAAPRARTPRAEAQRLASQLWTPRVASAGAVDRPRSLVPAGPVRPSSTVATPADLEPWP